MIIEKNFFRQVMGHFTTGVTIVTAKDATGPAGMTVNAFCSVSLEPPLVLICVDLKSTTLHTIRESGAFAVNILSDRQEGLSRCFASVSEERYKYLYHTCYRTAVTGSPVLNDTLGFVDVRVVTEYPGGDHTIFLGEVVALGVKNEEIGPLHPGLDVENLQNPEQPGNPLVFYRGRYQYLASGNEQMDMKAEKQLQEFTAYPRTFS